MDKFISPFRQNKTINIIFISNILLSFHYCLIVYINSSFLAQYFSDTQISVLYIIASILNIILFLNATRILNTLSNYKTTLYAISFETLAALGMAVARNPFLAGLYFLVHAVIIAFISFNLDVFLESATSDENKTGEIRSMFLTVGNVMWVIGPSIIAAFLIGNNYYTIYLLSLLFIIPMFYFVKKYLANTEQSQMEKIRVRETIRKCISDKNIYNIFSVQFLLQFFYSYMVIYMPIYLSKYIGFSWSQIGLMFSIMLLPFVLFEIPVGDLADEKYGEKEFLSTGLLIMGLSTIFISFVTVRNFWIWAVVLFITRIGAAFVEISSDTYFFKKVDQSRADVISFYRLNRPLSYVIAPIVAVLSLQFIPFQYTFIIIGSILIVGTKYSLALQDTK